MSSAGAGRGGEKEERSSAVVGSCDKKSSPNEMASLAAQEKGRLNPGQRMNSLEEGRVSIPTSGLS